MFAVNLSNPLRTQQVYYNENEQHNTQLKGVFQSQQNLLDGFGRKL